MKVCKLSIFILLTLSLSIHASSLIWPPEYQEAISMDSRSHGGGYSPYHNEFWMPQWSGDYIYRYDKDYNYLGYFDSNQQQMMQIWGDTDGSYYTANWNYHTITKKKSMTDNTALWSYNLGGTAGGVTADANYVYAMRHGYATLYVLNKANGSLIRSLSLTGGGTPANTLYGGLVVIDGYLIRGGYNGYIDRYDVDTGQYVDTFNAGYYIYGSMFDGQNYYIHQNDSSIEYFTMASPIPEINSMVLVFLGIAAIFVKYIK